MGDLFSLEILKVFFIIDGKASFEISAVCCNHWVIIGIDKQNYKPCIYIMVILCAGGGKFLAYCNCNIISIKNTQVLVFYFGSEGPRDQYVSLVYTKYKDEPGVSEVVWWLDGWKRGIYWLPAFIGLSCTNANPESANSEHNWTADNTSWRGHVRWLRMGGPLVTHISSRLWSCVC